MLKDSVSLPVASLCDTRLLAVNLAKIVGPGDMISLTGDLGTGKSEFARALIRTRISDDSADVPSPTFTLVQTYDAPDGLTIMHCDLYRLEEAGELYELGLEDDRHTSLMLIEWPDRLPLDWFKASIDIKLEFLSGQGLEGDERRMITISAPSEHLNVLRPLINEINIRPSNRGVS